MKKKKDNIFNTKKNEKLEKAFLKTNIGKAMFVVLAIGIITIILGFGIAIFECFLYLANSNIGDYSFLISLGTLSVVIGLICNILYIIVYTNYRNKNQKK